MSERVGIRGGGKVVSSRGLMAPAAPLKGRNGKGMKKTKSKIVKPDSESHSMGNVLNKNRKQMRNGKPSKFSKSQPASLRNINGKGGKKKGKFSAPKGGKGRIPRSKAGSKAQKGGKRKNGKKGKKGKNVNDDTQGMDEDNFEEEIDPYQLLKKTNHNALLRMFVHKLIGYPYVTLHLGDFGDQLQSSMINFSRDMILPQLMTLDNVDKMKSVINDRKLIYLLRQSFIRWLLVHKQQLKLLFKRKGDENAKNKMKYNIVVMKNHIIQKLGSTLNTNDHDIKDIISKLDTKTKMKYFHYLKSDIKNPFLAQLMAPIPKNILSNTKCNVPSISGKMPDMEEKKDEPPMDPALPAPDPPDSMLDPEFPVPPPEGINI